MNSEQPNPDLDEQVVSFEVSPSGLVIYDRDNPDAWISSDSVRPIHR